MTTSSPSRFLQEELAYAERHLARLRRIATTLEDNLSRQGFDETAVYEKLSTNKAYRQLHRDQAIFQQMWIRCHRHLMRLPAGVTQEQPDPQPEPHAPPASPPKMVEINLRDLHREAMAAEEPFEKPRTFRYDTPPPTRNQPCPCGSGLKYKRCCGNPVRQQPLAA